MDSPALTPFLRNTALAVLIIPAQASSGHAADPTPLETDGITLFADYYPDAADNISGATCFSTGRCLLVADERIAIQNMQLDIDGERPAYRPGRIVSALFDDWCRRNSRKNTCAKQEVDLEGIARQGNSVTVTGSMGNRRKSGNKARLRWFLARFSVTSDGNPIRKSLRIQSDQTILQQVFKADTKIGPFAEKPLQCGGLNIEGLAQIRDDLFFGLRSPARRKDGQALIVRTSTGILTARSAGQVKLSQTLVLNFRDSGGRPIKNIGIRALETFGKRLLIATGDAGVSAPDSEKKIRSLIKRCRAVLSGNRLPNISGKKRLRPRIWIWNPDGARDPVELTALSGAYRNEKLEGIALLGSPDPSAGSIDLLLTIDDPGDVPALAILRDLPVPQPR